MPEEVERHIFRFFQGETLLNVREVCKKWHALASDEDLWERICVQYIISLRSDSAVWPLITSRVAPDDPARWRKLYPYVSALPVQFSTLQMSGKIMCKVRTFHVRGNHMLDGEVHNVLKVSRKFNVSQLPHWILPNATLMYVEPVREGYRNGFNSFIKYLKSRQCAGLAIHGERRYILIPACHYVRTILGYAGDGIVCVIQEGHPVIAPAP